MLKDQGSRRNEQERPVLRTRARKADRGLRFVGAAVAWALGRRNGETPAVMEVREEAHGARVHDGLNQNEREGVSVGVMGFYT